MACTTCDWPDDADETTDGWSDYQPDYPYDTDWGSIESETTCNCDHPATDYGCTSAFDTDFADDDECPTCGEIIG